MPTNDPKPSPITPEACPDCGKNALVTEVATGQFPYGIAPNTVTLSSTHEIQKCGECGAMFSGEAGEIARQAAVDAYLAITPEEGKTVELGGPIDPLPEQTLDSKLPENEGKTVNTLAFNLETSTGCIAASGAVKALHEAGYRVAPKTVDYEAEVKKVWPDAHYQILSYTVWAEAEPNGVTLIGFGRTPALAWQDAYSKLPAPSTTSEAANIMPNSIGESEYDHEHSELESGMLEAAMVCKNVAASRIRSPDVRHTAIMLSQMIEDACGMRRIERNKSIPPPTIGGEGAERDRLLAELLPQAIDEAEVYAFSMLGSVENRQRQRDYTKYMKEVLAALLKAPQAAPLDEPIPAPEASKEE